MGSKHGNSKFDALDAIDDPKLVALIIAITNANGVDLTDPKNTYVGEIEPWLLDKPEQK